MSDNNEHPVGIIGGGISGLATALYLKEMGIESVVYESTDRIGGVIGSVHKEGWLVELGPNTLMARTETLWDLVQRLGLKADTLEPGKGANKRFIVRNGKPVILPASLMQFISTDLISATAKLRLFKEPFVPPAEHAESVADFFERRLGKEIVDYAVNPFIAGIFAGDPNQLSMAHTFSSLYTIEQEHGSLLKGAVKSAVKKKGSQTYNHKGLISFRNGIQQLTETLGMELRPRIRTNHSVCGVSRDGRSWKLEIVDQQGFFPHRALIYTAPLHRLPGIRFDLQGPEQLKVLSEMRYAPIATLALGFRREKVAHPLNGFGVLVPEVENFNILGCLFSSSLFEGRAPDDHILLTCFLGGERDPGLVDRPGDAIKYLALKDLSALLGVDGRPVFEHLHRWEKAIPQYRMDHGSRLQAIDQIENSNPGLFFNGNFREQVSVPGCIESSYETAGRVASFLQS